LTDVAKASQAISRPGIDPRKFVDVGIVSAVAVDETGVHADVTTLEGMEETVELSPPYAGAGYGLHLPIDLDHASLIAVPDGKWNAGGRVVGATWDRGSPPPREVIDNPDDVVLVVKPGQSLRVFVTGGGDVAISSDGGTITLDGQVAAGAGGIASPPMKKTDGDALMSALGVAIAALSAAPVSQAALTALQTALQAIGWPTAATSVTVR
jgi:hypothetical protein